MLELRAVVFFGELSDMYLVAQKDQKALAYFSGRVWVLVSYRLH